MALCNSLPDWNTEEVSCVKRNKKEILSAVEDMAEHLPKEDPGKGTIFSFAEFFLILILRVKRFVCDRPHGRSNPKTKLGFQYPICSCFNMPINFFFLFSDARPDLP